MVLASKEARVLSADYLAGWRDCADWLGDRMISVMAKPEYTADELVGLSEALHQCELVRTRVAEAIAEFERRKTGA